MTYLMIKHQLLMTTWRYSGYLSGAFAPMREG